MKITRVTAMPSKWTFTIKPIKELVNRYVGDGKGWVDPFAGMNSPAEHTNDLNPNMNAKHHMNAIDFCKMLDGKDYNGILLDPPYSPRQMKECYDSIGYKPNMKDTQNAVLYKLTKENISNKIKPSGIAICCGWNSSGFGKKYGFEFVEILLVNHGAGRYDTIVTVEKKMNNRLDL